MRRAFIVVASLGLLGAAPAAQGESPEILVGAPRSACSRNAWEPATWSLDGEVEVGRVLEALASLTCERFIVTKDLLKQKVKLSVRTGGELSGRELRERVVGALRAEGIALEYENVHRVARASDLASSLRSYPTRPARTAIPPAELDKGIACVERRCTITRELFERLFQDTSGLATSARIIPAMQDGRAVGFKLFAIRPGSYLWRLGLQNGDTVTAVNGLDVASPDKALEAYAAVRSAKKLTVDVLRRGEKITLEYVVK